VPTCTRCGFETTDEFRFCPECGAASADATLAREQRKTVTVLFCDLAGSTALGESVDPERLRALLAAYFERMKGIVERHGGSIEKFIGDAVMAVFGVPSVHEDDALRALRAAVEMRDALPELELEGRIGVTTGEVVTGTEERLATGDAVNVAARLEQAAPPGEVLIGTLALAREAVDAEPVEPLVLKGKTDPVPAFRLVRVLDVPGRRHGGPFVGRRDELELLRSAWVRACEEKRCELITIIGDAGVGKSRLVGEALRATGATVVQARCPPYGEGITYWPVVEVLKQIDTLPSNEAAVAAIRSLLGESEAATSAEEIAWAFRKTLEHAAAEEPLVVVFDDIQWGEQTFLDLVEHVALLSTGSAILLLCVARPELTELRTTWPVTVRLHPLGEADVEELIAGRASGNLGDKIARAAGGNPLFLEELLAISQDADEVIVPPTLQAVLAARLDRLDPAERRILERAAVEGEIFHRGAVQALAAEDTHVTPLLAALVRKELIKPDRPLLAGDDGFRFRHLLIRDAAYDALPKGVRTELHVRFATWFEEHRKDLVELDEILGYHLERACAYRAELGLEADAELAAAARRRLATGARRASARKDFGAAASLLERAVALLPANAADVALELALARALYESGRGVESVERSESLSERSEALGDRVGELAAKLQTAYVLQDLEPEGAAERLDARIAEALPELEAAGDDDALYTAHHARGMALFSRAQGDAALEAWELAARHARAAGISDELLGWRALARLYGTTPVTRMLAWLDEHEPRAGRDDWLRASRGVALAMLGRIDEGRAILATTRAELAERGGALPLAVLTGIESALVELFAGDPEKAAELGAEGCSLLDELGAQAFLSTAAAFLAESLYELGRLEEADAWAQRAAEVGSSEDLFTQPLWRLARAKVFARRGRHTEGERLAREALAIIESTQDLNGQGDAYADLAEVLLLGNRPDEAAGALEQALERYERKENRVSADRTRWRLEELAAAV
jgi:class 3 adenylate cyclase/predicted ATPase